MRITGVYPPIATPFGDRGRLDSQALAANVQRWNETGLDGYVVAGSNGEGILLEVEELAEAVRTVRGAATADMRVIAGVSAESTAGSIRLTRVCAEAGADAALVLTPSFYGSAMTGEALFRHFESLADASPVPIVIYNVPKFTHLNIAPETVARLATHDNIIGIKDSSGDITQIIELLRLCSGQLAVLIGNAPAFFSGLQAGAAGGILALANVAPRECVAINQLVAKGRYDEAREIHFRLMPVARAVTSGYGVAGLKAALDLLGYVGGDPRPPLLPASPDVRQAIADILEEAGLLC